MKRKCKREGCYETADCKHGYCAAHCTMGGHDKRDHTYRIVPKTSEPHIGVEIEVEFDGCNDMHRALALYTGCHDGSLGEYSAEFKILATESKIIGKASRLLAELWERRAKVNRSCGLHVHLDARVIGWERRDAMLSWLERTQDSWFALFPHSRQHNSYVCKLGYGNHSDHYTWAHWTRYNTLEVRLHGGTCNPHKLAGWLSAMIYLAQTMRSGSPLPATSDPDADFRTFWNGAPVLAREYINSRRNANGVLTDYSFDPMVETEGGE